MKEQNIADLYPGPIPANLIRDDFIKDGFEIISINKCIKCNEEIINVRYKKEKKEKQKNGKPKYQYKVQWNNEQGPGCNDIYKLCNSCFVEKQKKDREYNIKDQIKLLYQKNIIIRKKIKKIKNQEFIFNDVNIENVIGVFASKEWIVVFQLDKKNKRKKYFFDRNKTNIYFTTNAPIQAQKKYTSEVQYDKDGGLYYENEIENFCFNEEDEYKTEELIEAVIEESYIYKKHYEEFPHFFDENLYKDLKEFYLIKSMF